MHRPDKSIVTTKGGIVTKRFRGDGAEERFLNECLCLQTLKDNGCDFVPRITFVDPGALMLQMTFCGQRTLIGKERMAQLFASAEKYGVCHKDREIRNVVRDRQNRLYIVDWEHAEIMTLAK